MVKRKQFIKSLAALAFLIKAALPLDAVLIQEPWFYPPYQVHMGTDFGVSRFSDVNHGFNPIGYSSTNIGWNLYALVPFSSTLDGQGEVNFLGTRKKNFNLETFALQVRKQFLDDVEGDFVSLCWGFSYRYVPRVRLTDVATPYHNVSNFELFASLGKEFSRDFEWFLRTFLWAAAGQANTGYPWGRYNFSVKGKAYANYIIGVGSEGYFGAGGEKTINVNQFHSYAKIKHRSVDVYAQFGYYSSIWGAITFKYACRPYARSFPSDNNAFLLTYDYPFSF